MDITLVVLAVIVIVAIALVLALAMRSRGSRLRTLSEASRQHYADQWRTIEARFVDDPQGAVREADAMCLAILRDRGHPNDASKMPEDLREARTAVGPEARNGDTEGMRVAMLHYRAIVDDAIGAQTREASTRGREIAS